jgi:ATP-dependent protease HslVU (ClpYQ) peptidase subunit
MGQLLRYCGDEPPEPETDDLMWFMVRLFVPWVRSVLKDGGFAKKENEVETAGQILVGVKRRLFCLDSDYQIAEPANGIAAIGSGYQIALGALWTTARLGFPGPQARVISALEAAEEMVATVRGPFTLESTLQVLAT